MTMTSFRYYHLFNLFVCTTIFFPNGFLQAQAGVDLHRRQHAECKDFSHIFPRGPIGPRGRQGPRGFTGYPGPDGCTGPTGSIGPIGCTGYTGHTGSTGPRGCHGETGWTGPRGNTGYTGPVGEMGRTGSTGSTGSKGSTGATGATGATGPCGPTLSQAYGCLTQSSLGVNFTGDGGEIPSQTDPTVFTLSISENAIITSLEVTLNNFFHSWVKDVEAYITLPDGTNIYLFDQILAGIHYDGNYTFSDEGRSLQAAADSASNQLIPSGTYYSTGAPMNHDPIHMNALASGKSSSGNWSLTFIDHSTPSDSGRLESWTVHLNSNASLGSDFSLLPLAANSNEMSNMQPIGSELEILIDGNYEIFYSVFGRFGSGSTPLYVDMVVGVNGSNFTNDSLGRFSPSSQKSIFDPMFGINGSKGAILHLHAGDKIGLYLKSDTPSLLTPQSIFLKAILH